MNSFGNMFKITTWGESHGPALGVVIEGCPSGLELNENEITEYLRKCDRPIPELATERIEPNNVQILSGVNTGKTIGTPISILIKNENFKKKDYDNLLSVFRPGHGDYTYFLKYNIPSLSGGGRASGRICITRIAAGFIAEKVIKHYFKNFSIETKILSLAGLRIYDNKTLFDAIKRSLEVASKGDSSGGMIKLIIKGLPPGLGEPIFDGIDARLASALMSIGAVKSFEIGIGKKCANRLGSNFNDDFCLHGSEIGFISNNNGGVLSGITTGEDISITLSVKPTPSIRIPKVGITKDSKLMMISVTGRHDKNITPRIAPIAKGMVSLVLVDYLMLSGRISKDKLEAKVKHDKVKGRFYEDTRKYVYQG